MYTPDHILEQLNEQADLVSIIRRHTILKPAGREFKGCCPFHGEKTPSFFVNPESNLYYCFGCGAKGNAISFLMDYERLTFLEAVKTLSEQTGIELPKDEQKKYTYQKTQINTQVNPSVHHAQVLQQDKPTPLHTEPNHNQAQTQLATQAQTQAPLATLPTAQGDLYQLLTAVSHYYRQMLYQHPAAMHYLHSRGISQAMIDFFELGFAPTSWQHLQTIFPQDVEGLKILGLVRTSQNGRDFNLFRDRIIFPIKDKQGRIVGFAGRALDDDVTPKYINSSDSVIFQKQHILYGYYESRQQRAENWLIVEGYMDVIALYQAGIFGAVAPMGTAVNAGQITRLLKFNNALTLCFDGDDAGQRAALRTLEVALPVLEDGKELKFLTLPDNHDPDTYIKAKGTNAMRTAIGSALSLSDYLYHIIQQQYELTRPESKAAAMAYFKSISEKLPKGSSLRWWLNNDFYARLKQKNPKKTAIAYDNRLDKISPAQQLLLCILYQPSLVATDNNPLATLYQKSGLDQSHLPFVQRLKNAQRDIPTLPTWQKLAQHVHGLAELTAVSQNAHALFTNTEPNPQTIDANAHFILMGLDDDQLRTQLAKHWRDFFYHICHQSTAVDVLFTELLCQLLITCIRQEQSHADHLLINQLQKRRLLMLEQYHKNAQKPKPHHHDPMPLMAV